MREVLCAYINVLRQYSSAEVGAEIMLVRREGCKFCKTHAEGCRAK